MWNTSFFSLRRRAVVCALCLLVAGIARTQSEWRQAGAGPADRHAHAACYDVARQRVVVFGGNSGSGHLNDTWEWSQGTWQKRGPTTQPEARFHHAMAYDEARQRTVLFGGLGTATPVLGDTWLWDGSAWVQTFPTNSPPPRSHAQMAFDPIRRRVVLYGGSNAGFLYDTWEWDGTSWSALPSAGNPGLWGHLMVTDRSRGLILLFGPYGGGTWNWIGVRWVPVTVANAPQPRRLWAASAYDSRKQRTVLFGGMLDGDENRPSNETWEFDGAQWARRSSPSLPPGRYWQAMAYDPVGGDILVSGGRERNSRFSDTWLYAPKYPASYELLGAGCRGSAGIPRLALAGGLPWLGDTLGLEVTGLPRSGGVALIVGASSNRWGPIRLPFDLGAIGMPGCSLFASPDVPIVLANTGGRADASLAICDCPGLAGLSLFQQAIAVDASANTAGLVVSNGAEAKVGSR